MQFLLVEPIAKTPYPPLGLMKISSMLKNNFPGCTVISQVGNNISNQLIDPEEIYITSLFTWDLDSVVGSIRYYRRYFPTSDIKVGGIGATLVPEYIYSKTGVYPHSGLLDAAEFFPPDYSHTFGRKLKTSLTLASRGCIRKCKFCTVPELEPKFFIRNDWEKDISLSFLYITFWDNNWLASPNFENDLKKLCEFRKTVDFNQGLDARLYDGEKAKMLSQINIDPIRFAFDDISHEKYILHAIKLAKKYSNKEIRVYVLYNFMDDTPEDLFYRINLLNKEKVLAFPMEYRRPSPDMTKFPGKHWNTYLLRAFKLSLLFYYRKGMITESRTSFESIYGTNSKEFVDKLYKIYEYDKSLKRSSKDKV